MKIAVKIDKNIPVLSVKTLDFPEKQKTLSLKLEKNWKWDMIKGDITAGECFVCR